VNTNDAIEWTHGPFTPLAVITHTGELIRMSEAAGEERRCSDVSDVADRTTDSADQSDLRSDAGVAGLNDAESIPPLVQGGQGRSNYAALLSAVITVVCIGGMGLIVGIAVVSSVVRLILE